MPTAGANRRTHPNGSRSRWCWAWMAAPWECRYALIGGAARPAKNCRRCPPSRTAISARSRPAFCSCRKNVSRSRPDAARWCGAFLVSCLGDADAIFRRLYAQMRELSWLGAETMVVIVGDGAEWIWNRATWFVRRCEILDFWHALEHAWAFARLRYGEGSAQADQWVHRIAEDLRAGKGTGSDCAVETSAAEDGRSYARAWRALIRYYSENASRMRYDEYLRLGYGIGSGAVESAHKQVMHARLRQAGMRWSEAGARRLLALRLLLLERSLGVAGPLADVFHG